MSTPIYCLTALKHSDSSHYLPLGSAKSKQTSCAWSQKPESLPTALLIGTNDVSFYLSRRWRVVAICSHGPQINDIWMKAGEMGPLRLKVIAAFKQKVSFNEPLREIKADGLTYLFLREQFAYIWEKAKIALEDKGLFKVVLYSTEIGGESGKLSTLIDSKAFFTKREIKEQLNGLRVENWIERKTRVQLSESVAIDAVAHEIFGVKA